MGIRLVNLVFFIAMSFIKCYNKPQRENDYMSNDDRYKINKYTESILDGLGYEVVRGDGIQGVAGLIDKKSGTALPFEIADLVDLTEEEWLNGMADFVPGVKTTIFTGSNGERIYLDEFGHSEIFFDDNLSVKIPRFDEERQGMNISIDYGEDRKKSVSFLYVGFEESKNSFLANGIYVEDGHSNNDRIAIIIRRGNGWGDYNKIYSAEDCTTANMMSIIINGLRRIKKGYYWDDDLKYGLEVIGPALDLYAVDFRNDWIKYTDYIVRIEKESQDEARKIINKQLDIIVDSKARVNDVKAVKASLLSDPEVKTYRKKMKEVQNPKD